MGEFKGTKGSWRIGVLGSVQNERGEFICESEINKGSEEENKSNNTLISCAPEMLEMLKYVQIELNSCIRKLQFHGEEVDYQTLGEINLLIKKATE